MREADSDRLGGDTPAGAYVDTFTARVDEHAQRAALKGSSFELADKGSASEVPDELLHEIGRVADIADPVPASVIETAKKALPHDLDASNQIPNEALFLPVDQQFRLKP